VFPTLILSSFVGVCLPEAAVDRLVSTRTVVVQRQVMLKFAVLTGDPLGSVEAGTIKRLAEPHLSTPHKQTSTFLAGHMEDVRAGYAPQRIEIRTTPRIRLDGKIYVECETKLHRRNSTSVRLDDGSFAVAVDTQSVQTNAAMKPGETLKVRLSARSATEQTWLELSASVVEHPFAPAPALVAPAPLPAAVTQATYKVPVAGQPQTVCPEAALTPAAPAAFPIPVVPTQMPAVVPATPVGK
jgi:hypothetical protein